MHVFNMCRAGFLWKQPHLHSSSRVILLALLPLVCRVRLLAVVVVVPVDLPRRCPVAWESDSRASVVGARAVHRDAHVSPRHVCRSPACVRMLCVVSCMRTAWWQCALAFLLQSLVERQCQRRWGSAVRLARPDPSLAHQHVVAAHFRCRQSRAARRTISAEMLGMPHSPHFFHNDACNSPSPSSSVVVDKAEEHSVANQPMSLSL